MSHCYHICNYYLQTFFRMKCVNMSAICLWYIFLPHFTYFAHWFAIYHLQSEN